MPVPGIRYSDSALERVDDHDRATKHFTMRWEPCAAQPDGAAGRGCESEGFMLGGVLACDSDPEDYASAWGR